MDRSYAGHICEKADVHIAVLLLISSLRKHVTPDSKPQL